MEPSEEPVALTYYDYVDTITPDGKGDKIEGITFHFIPGRWWTKAGWLAIGDRVKITITKERNNV